MKKALILAAAVLAVSTIYARGGQHGKRGGYGPGKGQCLTSITQNAELKLSEKQKKEVNKIETESAAELKKIDTDLRALYAQMIQIKVETEADYLKWRSLQDEKRKLHTAARNVRQMQIDSILSILTKEQKTIYFSSVHRGYGQQAAGCGRGRMSGCGRASRGGCAF